MEEKKRHTTSIPQGVAAAAAYFFPFIGGLVMLAIEEENPFVRFHASQSILFWVIAIPWAFLSAIPVIGVLFSIAFFIAWIFLMYQAWTGREFEIPYLGAVARRQVNADKGRAGEPEEPESEGEAETGEPESGPGDKAGGD
jgi:uncharacterized membrane protein